MPQVAFLTQHAKAPLLSDALGALGWQLQVVTAFDTDLLGSFAGERPRFMTAAECALRKAAIAAELAGTDIGLGSEGSFTAGPYGLGTLNQELVCAVNVAQGWAVTAVAQQLCSARSWSLQDNTTLDDILASIPAGQLMLIKQAERVAKALPITECKTLAEQWLAQGPLMLQYDLRAHCSPERQQVIRQAAEHLAKKLQAPCPACRKPGFWPEQPIAGLPCADCGAPSSQAKGQRACCHSCGYQQDFLSTASFADPACCPLCNP